MAVSTYDAADTTWAGWDGAVGKAFTVVGAYIGGPGVAPIWVDIETSGSGYAKMKPKNRYPDDPNGK